MFGSIFGRVTVVGSLVAVATLTMGNLAAFAQRMGGDCSAIQFEVANPAPGSRIDPGNYVLQGIALDTRSEDGPGIERVDFFLGSRDDGGVLLGHAFPTEGGGPFAPTSFQAVITVPNQPGGHELFGYAHSSVVGQESILSIPIAVGVDPNKAGDVITHPVMSMCHTGSDTATAPAPVEQAPVAEAQPAPAEPPAEMAPAPSEAPSSKMYLDVGNPASGDSVRFGGLMIEGIAFDGAADSGAGIERIDLFIDDRDAGGTLIGHATLGLPNPTADDPNLADSGWNAQVMLTPRMAGGHTMFVYALSAATGEELVVGVPIMVVP